MKFSELVNSLWRQHDHHRHHNMQPHTHTHTQNYSFFVGEVYVDSGKGISHPLRTLPTPVVSLYEFSHKLFKSVALDALTDLLHQSHLEKRDSNGHGGDDDNYSTTPSNRQPQGFRSVR